MSSAANDGDIVEAVVCKVDDLLDGQMKEVEVGNTKALLIKDSGCFHAIGNKCTHYGAPLVKGAIGNGHVRCPWHGACFNFKTGDIEDFPGLDSVPIHEVIIDSNNVKIRLNKSNIGKRQKSMASASSDDKRSFVVVGGGPATVTCVETLRQEGYTGQITVISKDNNIAYDRPKLSKALTSKAGDIAMRNMEFYTKFNINYQTASEVSSVNLGSNCVNLGDGSQVKYDKLLLATGATPRQCTFIKNHDLENIHTLRTVEDANTIAAKGNGKKVLIIGTSFIGVEVAAAIASSASSVTIIDLVEAPFQLALGKEVGNAMKKVAVALVQKASSVTVIGLGEAPLLVLGKEVGSVFRKLLEEKGIKFFFKNSVTEFIGENGKLSKAILKDGTVLEADLCVAGIGVAPTTEFLKDSGLSITDRGFVTVNKHMKTSQDNVFAAGDITHFPLFMMDDEYVNIQHWQMAHQQGRVAALNMLEKSTEIKSVPYFWTVIFGKSLRYCGYGVGYDDIIIHGELEQLKFVAYYTKGDKVIAVASLNYDPIVSISAEMLLSGEAFTKELIKSETWKDKLEQIQLENVENQTTNEKPKKSTKLCTLV